jgi:hypothetical protein
MVRRQPRFWCTMRPKGSIAAEEWGTETLMEPSLTEPPYLAETKLPYTSSGQTTLILVTISLILTRVPILSVRKPRMPQKSET